MILALVEIPHYTNLDNVNTNLISKNHQVYLFVASNDLLNIDLQ